MVLVLLIFATLVRNTESLSSKDLPEVHGMLVFGTEEIYLSHLPMFHPPHDYQIILAAEFDRNTEAAYRKSRKAHPEERVYTLEPLPFVLREMVQTLRPFTATLYRGHFERGGIPIAGNVPVNIKRLLFFKRLVADATKREHQNYILFGNNKEWFLAHQIVAKPDFDEIASVAKQSGMLEKRLKKDGKVFLTITDSKDNGPLKEDQERLRVVLENTQLPILLHDVKIYYLELGDLAL
ncbi:MAG: hypothetical protein AB7P18_23005 [Candidatus Binatia bacterium]